MNIANLRNSLSSKTLLFLAAVSFVFMGMFGGVKPAFAASTWYVDASNADVQDGLTPTTAFTSIQAAIDAATEGDTINVYPGVYNEGNVSRDIYTGASPGANSGLLVFKDGLTIQGVDASGNPITNRTGVAATVKATQRDASLGDTVITGDNVTVSGLRFELAVLPVDGNKNVFATGENFTLKNSVVDNLILGFSGLYLSDERGGMHVNNFLVQNNQFLYGEITITNGVGQTGSASGRMITGNLMEHITDWAAMSLMGITGSGWTTQPIGDVTITGNTFNDNAFQIIARGSDYANPAGYWTGFLANNTFDKAVLTLTSDNDARMNDFERLGWVNSLTDPSKNQYLRMIGTNLQESITRATAGDTIKIAAGEYTEVGQIVIDKNLTISGADKTTTIIKPAQDTTNVSHADSDAWILVNSDKTFNLSGVTLNGDGRLTAVGILSHGHGTIDSNVFKNIVYNPSVNYRGIAVELYGSDMTVSNNSFSNIGRIGVFNGFGTNSTITGNTYTGKGVGTWLDYGFEVGRGSQSVISNNTVSNNLGVAADTSTSAGILVTSYFNPETPSQATITNNTISNNTDGIAVGYDEFDASTVVANYNNFSGNTKAVSSTHPAVDATHNSWGTADPTAIADMVYGSVDTSNPIDDQQLILSGDTDLDTSHTEVVVGDNSEDSTITIPETVTEPTINFSALLETSGEDKTVTTTAELTIDSTTGSSGSVNVTLPAGLVITGNSSWDGVINAPTNKITEFVLNGGDVSSAIEVGLTNQSLTFNKAVRLLFAGKTGKKVGYDPGNGLYPITTLCTADDQATVDAQLTGNSECKFDNGTDMIVWTKHFTTFATYAPVINSGGGGGGGSSYTPPTPAVPVAVVPPVVPPVVPTVPQGQVLGETLINSHPEGTFISIGKAIYIVSAGKKLPFANYSEFQSYGKVTVIPASEADRLLPDGNIVRAKAGTIALDSKERRTVYLINEKGEKQGFATYSAFVRMKYKLSQVKRLDLSVYPVGEVIN